MFCLIENDENELIIDHDEAALKLYKGPYWLLAGGNGFA